MDKTKLVHCAGCGAEGNEYDMPFHADGLCDVCVPQILAKDERSLLERKDEASREQWVKDAQSGKPMRIM